MHISHFAQIFEHNISNPNLQRRIYSMPVKPQPPIREAILVFLIASVVILNEDGILSDD